MAWTTPMTAVANSVFTASQFNTYVRDNLKETMPAKATAAGQYFVSDDAHSLVARTPACNSTIPTSFQSVTGSTWTDLTHANVTATTGTEALVHIATYMDMDTSGRAGLVSYRVSGDSTIAADDHPCRLIWDGIAAQQGTRQGVWGRLTSLTAGTNTFTMQSSTASGITVRTVYSHIIVVPLS